MFHRAEQDRSDRAGGGQNEERTGYFLGLSPSDILVDRMSYMSNQ